jgi:hypothetical protein
VSNVREAKNLGPGSFKRAKHAGVGLTMFTWMCSRLTGNLKFSGQQPLYFAAVISLVTLPLPSRN